FLPLVLCSALLASALVSILRLRNRNLVMLGALVALTPEVIYLASVQNTAGLEIAATLGLWGAGLALVSDDVEPDRRLVVRLGVALTLLVLARGLSPGFALVSLAVLLVIAPPARRRALLRRRDLQVATGIAAGAVVVSAVWLLYIQIVYPLNGFPASGFDSAV